MPHYRIHRMKEASRQQFRTAAHASGATIAKPKDYEQPPGEPMEAASPYTLWAMLKDSPECLHVGDILEVEGGDLSIYKFVGFEPARWWVPEPKPAAAAPTGVETEASAGDSAHAVTSTTSAERV